MNQLDLLKMNVNDHTEKKNGLTYLSWAWAWAEVLKADPKANFKVEMFDGTPLMMVGGSFMVWITVTVFDKPVTCMLPVLDYRNKVIPTPNAFDVNTSIMRCLVKAIAMHGLGLYIYAGEDLPESEVKEKIKKVEMQPTEWDNSDASRGAFTDLMIRFTDTCTTLQDLSSYWASNKLQLDSLKTTHPEMHFAVLTKFSETKKTLQG